MNAAVEVTARNVEVFNAFRDVSRALRPVHSVLLDATRLEYERQHGQVSNRAALLQLVLNDQAFAWLRPLSDLMANIDALAEAEVVEPAEILALRAAVESWVLVTREGDQGFPGRYVELLQVRPELVIAHGELRAAVKRLQQVAVPLARSLFSPGLVNVAHA